MVGRKAATIRDDGGNVSDDNRIEFTEVIAYDHETDTGYRRWITPDGTVVREEVYSPSPWRILDFVPPAVSPTAEPGPLHLPE